MCVCVCIMTFIQYINTCLIIEIIRRRIILSRRPGQVVINKKRDPAA